MKSLSSHFFIFKKSIQPLSKCESILTSLGSRALSVWQSLLTHVRTFLLNLAAVARRKVQITLLVRELSSQLHSLSHNKRHVVGIALWMVGICVLFAHFFFDPYSMEHQVCGVLGFNPERCWNGKGGAESTGWCYTSWFDYIVQIRFFAALLFWSAALPLLVPVKKSLCVVVASTFFAVGSGFILHYSFFSTSYETINAFPHWRLFAIGLALGGSIIMSTDYLVHAYNHRTLAFEKRLFTLYNGADLVDDKTFKGLFKKFVEEKKAFQKEY